MFLKNHHRPKKNEINFVELGLSSYDVAGINQKNQTILLNIKKIEDKKNCEEKQQRVNKAKSASSIEINQNLTFHRVVFSCIMYTNRPLFANAIRNF